VGPTPTFVVGLHEAITRLRMSLAFDQQQVPSVYSKPHPNSLRFHNYFPQGAGGSLTIVVPKNEAEDRLETEPDVSESAAVLTAPWTIDPPQGAFKLARDEDTQFPFQIRLKNAMFGKQPIRIEFNIEADEHYQFSVYREMEVGTGDLTLKVRTHLDDDDSLVVEQLMTNQTKNLADFKCYLYANGQRRQRTQVYRLGSALDRKIYRFPNGPELIDKEMLLEIEELSGGERVLRHRFKVIDSPPEEVDDPAESEEQEKNPRRADAATPAESTPSKPSAWPAC
jgi:hypothetical protein